jgi:hypothetical protein
LRWAGAWLLYWIGNVASWFIPMYEDSRWHWWHKAAFFVYNRCMGLSADVQGPSGNGPWSRL